MCGISGIISTNDTVARPFLLNALSKLENRGYDGFGIKIAGHPTLKVGPYGLGQLLQTIAHLPDYQGTMGICHNRWATHGEAAEVNSHPHEVGTLTLVHNGTIDDLKRLSTLVQEMGYTTQSQTDTEVLGCLIHAEIEHTGNFFKGTVAVLQRLQKSTATTFGVLVMDSRYPNQMIAASVGSPLLFGFNDGSTYLASEESALSGYVQTYRELQDGDVIMFSAGMMISHENLFQRTSVHEEYDIDEDYYALSETDPSISFLEQEIKDGPSIIFRALGRGSRVRDGIVLGGLDREDVRTQLQNAERCIIVGCGTSYNAAVIMAQLIEEYAHVPAQAYIASELMMHVPVLHAKTTVAFVVSQSGETADTRSAMERLQQRGVMTLGIVNRPNSHIWRKTTAGVSCRAGKELSVASTKAFLGQVVCAHLIAFHIASLQGRLSVAELQTLAQSLCGLEEQAKTVLEQTAKVMQQFAEVLAQRKPNIFFLGRNYNYAVAREGALKLKEVTYLHAESYPAGEMKHGPIAMIDDEFFTVIIAPNDSTFSHARTTIQEVRARSKNLCIITTDDVTEFDSLTPWIVKVPKVSEQVLPFLTVLPLQLLALYTGLALGLEVDKPRNLAKTVTTS